MINIKIFHSNLLEIDKKPYKDFDSYYIGYIMILKNGDCENIHSVNPLYLTIYSATGYFKEKYGEKYLIIDLIEKYEEDFSGIKSEIETTAEKKHFMKKIMQKLLKVNTDDNVPLNKRLKFPSLTIIIRWVFQNGKKWYPQIYLDEYLYEL